MGCALKLDVKVEGVKRLGLQGVQKGVEVGELGNSASPLLDLFDWS